MSYFFTLMGKNKQNVYKVKTFPSQHKSTSLYMLSIFNTARIRKINY